MLKRLFDIIISVSVLIIGLPIICVIIISILIFDGMPIFFIHTRSGKNKIPFNFIKFRTMKNDSNKAELDRVTWLGNILRQSSLDELPSFFNVLKGDMSVVGPRPLLQRYLSRYNDQQVRRLEVKPGITGLAQIKGRNLLSWEERFSYDVHYVDHQNIFLDLKIIILTINSVITRKGIMPEKKEIMPEFLGSDSNKFINKATKR